MKAGFKQGQKGVSLLELLVSIMLLTIVMMSFAMVFPGGYRLNLKNRMGARATKYAEGIMYKVQNIPFLGQDITRPTVENLQTWDIGTFKELFEDTIPSPFYLPPASDNTPGIKVEILDPTVGGGGTLAKISVTVGWDEVTKAGVLKKRVTVTTYRSKNHQ